MTTRESCDWLLDQWETVCLWLAVAGWVLVIIGMGLFVVALGVLVRR